MLNGNGSSLRRLRCRRCRFGPLYGLVDRRELHLEQLQILPKRIHAACRTAARAEVGFVQPAFDLHALANEPFEVALHRAFELVDLAARALTGGITRDSRRL